MEDARTVQGTTDARTPLLKDDTLESKYDHHCRTLIEKAGHDAALGWAAELCRYLADIPENATKNMDIIDWWSKHATLYPTLAWIAQDICAILASSVPCKHLFSAGAEIATHRWSHLDAERFEELQILKHAWQNSIIDHVDINSKVVMYIYLEEYKELYKIDGEFKEVDLTPLSDIEE